MSEQQEAWLAEVLQLVHECRLLAAKLTYDKLLGSLEQTPNPPLLARVQAAAASADLVQREQDARELLAVGDALDASWVLGSTLFGTTTHYRLEDDGTMTLRMEGELDNLPLFEQLAVINEVDLFKEWIPFCDRSTTVTRLGQAEIVAYFGVFVPPLSRDSLIRAYGVDCLQEHGKVLLLGASVDDWPVPGDGDGDGGTSSESGSGRSTSSSGKQPASVFNIQRLMGGGGSGSGSGKTSASSSSSATDTAAPWRKPSGWFTDRMVVKRFRSIITVLSPSTAKTIIVAHVDPKVALPQSLINFVMRNMAGILLNVFQRQVQYVAAHPRCLHADKVRENRGFYEEWLLPKVQRYCAAQGWAPPRVSSLSPGGGGDEVEAGAGALKG